MTSRNVKSTWELAGRLSGSFTDSTKKAQSQLSQLRREYSANQGELRRMQAVLKTASQGTDAYANAQRRVPQLQDEINRQAFAISDVQREALGGARAQGRLASATGRAGSALRALSGFGLAAGAGIGVAAGAAALLTKNLNSAGQEAQALQALSVRGVDTDAYQAASNRLRILTGDAATAQRAVGSVADSGQRVREALAYDPKNLNFRAFAGLGFDTAREFEQATRNVTGFIEHLRGELQGATQNQKDYIRAASVAAGIDPTLIDSIEEENRLLVRQADLKVKASGGDLAAAKELERITARIGRIQNTQGIYSPEQIAALERYDETTAIFSQATKDLKIAVTTSFADDMAAAATGLTEGVLAASRLYDRISGEEGTFAKVSRMVRTPNKEVEGWFDRNVNQRLGLPSFGNSRDGGSQWGAKDLRSINDALEGWFDRNINQRLGLPAPSGSIPGFAQGGMVPGPRGRPQLAMVHGGEQVMTPGQQRQSTDRSSTTNLSVTNNFTFDGTSEEVIAEDIARSIQSVLHSRILR